MKCIWKELQTPQSPPTLPTAGGAGGGEVQALFTWSPSSVSSFLQLPNCHPSCHSDSQLWPWYSPASRLRYVFRIESKFFSMSHQTFHDPTYPSVSPAGAYVSTHASTFSLSPCYLGPFLPCRSSFKSQLLLTSSVWSLNRLRPAELASKTSVAPGACFYAALSTLYSHHFFKVLSPPLGGQVLSGHSSVLFIFTYQH